MKRLVSTTLAIVLPALASAQAKPPTLFFLPAERSAAEAMSADRLRSHIRFLASDLLEGRGPATRGDQLAEAYIASQMEGLGLEPAGAGGTFFQPFEIVGVTSHVPDHMVVSKGFDKLDLRYRDDFIAVSGDDRAESSLDSAEIVFVGFGVVAPEFDWNDYKGMDLKGKVLLMMNHNPQEDPKAFAGKKRLYYGRWDYKYDIAAKMGAAGAIVIHTTPSAGYPWQVVQSSWSGEQFSVPNPERRLQVRAWATEDASRKIAQLGGQDLDALRAAAQKRDFHPVPLGVTVSLLLKNDVQRKQTANVIGRFAGADPLLQKEAVLYTAHHDHLGVRVGARPGEDAIYNGALDNASGVAAMLTIAEAWKRLPHPPRRAVYFAAVAGEEQGLLGSQYLAAHPPVPPGRIAVDINIDGINIWGKTKDVCMIGLGKSTVDDYVRKILEVQGREVRDDPEPDKGYFYRSDQLSFARIGVPSAFFDAGIEVIGKPPGWGKAAHQKFEENDYHQPSDELRPDWDFTGAVEDAQFLFYLGLKISKSDHMPVLKPGDEFEGVRKKFLAELPHDPAPAH